MLVPPGDNESRRCDQEHARSFETLGTTDAETPWGRAVMTKSHRDNLSMSKPLNIVSTTRLKAG